MQNSQQMQLSQYLQSIVIPAEADLPEVEFNCEDQILLNRALIQEIQTLRSQVTTAALSSSPEQLNELLECISAMRIQFQYNQQIFNKLNDEKKAVQIESQTLRTQMQNLREQTKSALLDVEQKQIRVNSLEQQLQLQTAESQQLKQKINDSEMRFSNQLLNQINSYQIQFSQNLQLKQQVQENQQLSELNATIQKQLLSNKQLKEPAPQQIPQISELLQKINQLEQNNSQLRNENKAMSTEVLLLKQRNHSLSQSELLNQIQELEQNHQNALQDKNESIHQLQIEIETIQQELICYKNENQSLQEEMLKNDQISIIQIQKLNQQINEVENKRSNEIQNLQQQINEIQEQNTHVLNNKTEHNELLVKENMILQSMLQNGATEEQIKEYNEMLQLEINVLRAQ
ncbi:Conserved_hypothetical protein [Hexamita inflata]|uniref:Uncharacterized protein n=1 Tax=Hexamita inflata TaxID=28002 RepID=A0AA86TVF7_9EUKA|nr:Conserved hypothetical protein [Hexamita inflata]